MEMWRDIPGFPGYQASDHGQVRSIDRTIPTRTGATVSLRGKLLTQRVQHGKGYRMVTMGGNNKLVHRLVLLAFRGEPEPGQECRHLNGDPSDNKLDNLAWGTKSENSVDQVRHGTHRNISKTHCVRGHEFTPENTYTRPNGTRMCRACRFDRGEVNGKYTKSRNYRRDDLATHCLRGHPFTDDNTYVRPGGSRHCRICRLATEQKRKSRSG